MREYPRWSRARTDGTTAPGVRTGAAVTAALVVGIDVGTSGVRAVALACGEDGAVGDVLRSGWLTSGPKVQAFEAALSAYFGGRPVRTFNSGTCTMEIALRIAGIGPGDEVITTPISWVATANVIIEVGATPVFADIDPVTRNIDPVLLERGRMTQLQQGYDHASPTTLRGLAYVAFQELATRIAHRNTGRYSSDPVADRIMVRIAADENLHMVFYRDILGAALKIQPSAAVRAIVDEVAEVPRAIRAGASVTRSVRL